MLFATSQIEKMHGFEEDVVQLKCKNETLENVQEFKLFEITIAQLEKTPKQYNK